MGGGGEWLVPGRRRRPHNTNTVVGSLPVVAVVVPRKFGWVFVLTCVCMRRELVQVCVCVCVCVYLAYTVAPHLPDLPLAYPDDFVAGNVL